jgi:hypothetical protein
MKYPRPVRSIHQIELTTYCNLRCRYCPYPQQEKLRQQAKMHMEWDIYKRAIEWAVHLNEPNDTMRNELSLTGVGEPLMHPHFVEMLAYAREKLPRTFLVFSTNGILLTEELCKEIAPYNPRIFVSLHRPEKAGHAIQAAKKYDLLHGFNPAAAVNAFDWAGQVDWFVSAPPITCEYLQSGWGVVLVDGRLTNCCVDASALGVFGHVNDPFEMHTVEGTGLRPFSLCSTCHMTVP